MSATITYTPINQGEFYTIDEVNALFAVLAEVINNKLDQAEQQTDAVYVGEVLVVVTDSTVDEQDPTLPVELTKQAILSDDLTVNGQEILNAGTGVNAGDSVNVLQALQILGILGQ